MEPFLPDAGAQSPSQSPTEAQKEPEADIEETLCITHCCETQRKREDGNKNPKLVPYVRGERE